MCACGRAEDRLGNRLGELGAPDGTAPRPEAATPSRPRCDNKSTTRYSGAAAGAAPDRGRIMIAFGASRTLSESRARSREARDQTKIQEQDFVFDYNLRLHVVLIVRWRSVRSVLSGNLVF